ncbi:MAG: hypothetical protein JO345_06365 [Streptosporangiaceae bacterium]|nr:hypothetical protein [Streptosporangiaceae bacterium]
MTGSSHHDCVIPVPAQTLTTVRNLTSSIIITRIIGIRSHISGTVADLLGALEALRRFSVLRALGFGH